MKKTALRASGLVLLLAMAAGCATTGLDEVKATADRAAADASAAASASLFSFSNFSFHCFSILSKYNYKKHKKRLRIETLKMFISIFCFLIVYRQKTCKICFTDSFFVVLQLT